MSSAITESERIRNLIDAIDETLNENFFGPSVEKINRMIQLAMQPSDREGIDTLFAGGLVDANVSKYLRKAFLSMLALVKRENPGADRIDIDLEAEKRLNKMLDRAGYTGPRLKL
jgi:hypothetical protein